MASRLPNLTRTGDTLVWKNGDTDTTVTLAKSTTGKIGSSFNDILSNSKQTTLIGQFNVCTDNGRKVRTATISIKIDVLNEPLAPGLEEIVISDEAPAGAAEFTQEDVIDTVEDLLGFVSAEVSLV